MKEGWTYKKLGEVATFINGYPFKPTDWKNSGRKIIRIQNLNNPNATYNFYDGSIDPKYLVSNGDVLISWSGSLGVFEWSEDEAILNQHIFKVVFNKGHINKKFFEYVVASRINEMKSKVHGVTMQHITKKEFDVILIPVPPIAEQERIVAELDLLQGIIEKKKEQLKAYDQLAQSIFYSMFGDPIDNPKGWEVKTIGNTCTITCGQDYKTVEDENGKYPIYGTGGIMGWANQFRCPKDSVIIGRKGNINNPILVNADFWNVDTAFGVTPNNDVLSAIYFFFFCKEYDFTQHDVSVTIPSLRRTDILKIKLPVPPLSLQQEFAEKVEAIERQKALVQQSIEETQTMFDYTMDKYFG